LVAVDDSPESDAAVRWAAHESAMRDAPVTLMHVIAPVVVSWPVEAMILDVPEWYENSARNILECAEKTFRSEWTSSRAADLSTVVGHDGVISVLTNASKDAGLVVVGNRGLGTFRRLLLGSVSNGLLHHAHCPVAVIHVDEAYSSVPDGPVLLGIDGSPASEAATALAFDEASRRDVGLVALHAWSDVAVSPALGIDWRDFENEAKEVLSERLAGWQEQYPDVHVERRIVCDTPARWLVEQSELAQLVVVGSHGRGGFEGMLLGSTSSAVAQASSAPVIVVRNR
jgi:nucleotide-binding universal stress UspA family protein